MRGNPILISYVKLSSTQPKQKVFVVIVRDFCLEIDLLRKRILEKRHSVLGTRLLGLLANSQEGLLFRKEHEYVYTPL